jgi:hypothetical protein
MAAVPVYDSSHDAAMEGSGIECSLCNKFVAKSWQSLANHFRRNHGIKSSDLKDTYLLKKANAERAEQDRARYAGKKQHVVEAAARPPSLQREESVAAPRMQPSAPPSLQLAESVAAPRMQPSCKTKADGSQWRAYWVKVDASGFPVIPLELEDMDEEEEPVQLVSKFFKPTCKRVAKPPSSDGTAAPSQPVGHELREVRDLLKQLLDPAKREPEITLPPVLISDEASTWAAASLNANARRHTWPIRRKAEFDFTHFLQHLQGRGLAKKSIEILHQGVQYFLALLVIEDDGFTLEGLMVKMYIDNIGSDLFQLPVLGLHFSWTFKILSAVSFLCDWLVVECGRLRHDEAARCIRQFSQECLAPKKKVAGKHKRHASIRRSQSDANRVAQLPPTPVLKTAVKQAMVDLRTILQHVLAGGELCAGLKRAANVAMVGVLFCNGFAGRSKECNKTPLMHFTKQRCVAKWRFRMLDLGLIRHGIQVWRVARFGT